MPARRLACPVALVGAALLACAGPEPAAPPAADAGALRVVSLNAWHGRRTSGWWRFPGESDERRRRRYAIQERELAALAPDLVLLQEVDPAPARARELAAALGMDEVHRVVSCGVHLGPLLKVPVNLNSGLAILARPELGLREVAAARLSGPGGCFGDHLGFQVRESRYALLAEVRFGGRRLLVATVHLHAPPAVAPDAAAAVAGAQAAGEVSAAEGAAFLDAVTSHRRRLLMETERLLGALARRRAAYDGVILGGDFNAGPGSAPIVGIGAAGFAAAPPAPGIATWDAAANVENASLGGGRRSPLETFGREALAALVGDGAAGPRRIDWIFVAGDLRPLAGRRVLDRADDGIYPSDHFGLLAEVGPGAAGGAASGPAGRRDSLIVWRHR